MGLLGISQGRPTFKFLKTSPSAYEKMLIERANALLLTQWLLPRMLTAVTPTNFVDPRIAAPKVWRDVYHYDDRGNFLGWTRYGQDKTLEFNVDGLLIVAKDELGRCRQGRRVGYVQEPRTTPGLNHNPLRMIVLNDLFVYEYAGPDDRQGRMVAKGKAPASK